MGRGSCVASSGRWSCSGRSPTPLTRLPHLGRQPRARHHRPPRYQRQPFHPLLRPLPQLRPHPSDPRSLIGSRFARSTAVTEPTTSTFPARSLTTSLRAAPRRSCIAAQSTTFLDCLEWIDGVCQATPTSPRNRQISASTATRNRLTSRPLMHSARSKAGQTNRPTPLSRSTLTRRRPLLFLRSPDLARAMHLVAAAGWGLRPSPNIAQRLCPAPS